MIQPTRISISDNNDGTLVFRVDCRSKGSRIFYIVCEIILLVVYIPLTSRIPASGAGISIHAILITYILAPISLFTGYGIIVSLRQKEINIDKKSRTGTLINDYSFFRKAIPFHFDDVAAVLLESPENHPPLDQNKKGNVDTVEALLIFRNGKRKWISRGYLRGSSQGDVEMLHDELERAIMVGQERPVQQLTERVFISKYPTNDGIGIIEVSRKSDKKKLESLTTSVIAIMLLILFTWLSIALEFYNLLFAAVIFPAGFAVLSLAMGIPYLVSSKAKTTITVDEKRGILEIKSGNKARKVEINIRDIKQGHLNIEKEVVSSRSEVSVSSSTYFFYRTNLILHDNQQVQIHKSDRFLEVSKLGKILNAFLSHAAAVQKDPSVPPLPVLTYDELYKIRDGNLESIYKLD